MKTLKNVDQWIDRFQSAPPDIYHQFKQKTDKKKEQMARSAYYKAKQSGKLR